MPTFLLAIYTVLVLIRPMDWWEPILEWQLVTVAAIATLLVTFPQILEETGLLWRSLPEIKMGAGWVLGAVASYLPIFWLEGMSTIFQELGKIYVYFFLIYLLGRTPQGYRILLWAVLGSTIFMAIHAVLQHYRGVGFGNLAPLWRVRDPETGEGVWQARAFGTFEDPNDLCLVFIISIPLLYAEYKSASAPLLRGLALGAIPLLGYGVFLTNSRGGYLSILAMVSAYLMARTKGFKRWFLLAFSIFFLTVFAPSRFAAGFVGQQDRSILWGDGVAMFKANPFFGVGFYNFTEYSNEHKVAHNTYVHVLAETGIIGYVPFFLMIYFSVLHLRRAMNLGPLLAKQDRVQLAGIFSAAVGFYTALYFLSRQYVHITYIVTALVGVKAVGACRTPEMFNAVFTQTGKDWRNALLWALGSIGFMWVTIRIVNAAG